MSLTEQLKQSILDFDLELQRKKFADSGLVPVCAICGEQLTGFPLGARVENPICEDCLEREATKQVVTEANIPPIGYKSNVVFQETRHIVVPKDG